MSHFTRRQFVTATAAGLGLLPAIPRWSSAAPAEGPRPTRTKPYTP